MNGKNDVVSERKKRKIFRPSYEDGISESDIEEELVTHTAFDLADKLVKPGFTDQCLRIVTGNELTMAYFQKHGFATPMLCKEKTGLDMRVPPSSFTVTDVKACVGGDRLLDVMNVSDQSSLSMTMEEWDQYYNSKHKSRLLNVISLEFSLTKLDKMVACPLVVRAMDWVNTAWPSELRARQSDSTNNMAQMMYPKVQKYCLMSVKGCYTDFHIDFGGTSVWYHIIRGGKVFWLVPPNDHTLKLYEEWTLSGRQGSIFFGDIVDECYRVTLKAGNTFFIPAGWIHAVYTPEDSLVFGGNFLHSFAIERQLRTAQIEDTTKVPQKFRYPFYSEMLWYVLARYVEALLGVQHLNVEESEVETKPPEECIHLTTFEISGIKAIVMYLHALPANRKNIPDLIKDPVALIRDVRLIVERHRNDKPHLSQTGVYALSLASSNKANLVSCLCDDYDEPVKAEAVSDIIVKKRGRKPKNRYLCEEEESPIKSSPKKVIGSFPRRRRTRCRECEACLRDDCGECIFCADMTKFGGQGKAKQTCKARQCLKPLLPITATCVYCNLDGWMKEVAFPCARPTKESPSSLMECISCFEIAHTKCLEGEYDIQTGEPQEEMLNSWVCPKCVSLGKNRDIKPRHFKARDRAIKIKIEEPSTSSTPSGGEALTPQKCKSPYPNIKSEIGGTPVPPEISFGDFRSPSTEVEEGGERRSQSKRRYSDENDNRKKKAVSRLDDSRRGESRAESRTENEERIYAAIQKTRECLNYQTLKELAMATGRSIRHPIVVIRPITDRHIANLEKLEKEKQEEEVRKKKIEEQKTARALKLKEEETEKQNIKIKREDENDKGDTSQRVTRLQAEREKVFNTRVTRGKSSQRTETLTPEKNKTKKGKEEEADIKKKQKIQEETKSKGKQNSSECKKRGRQEERASDAEEGPRRLRSSVSSSPCSSSERTKKRNKSGQNLPSPPKLTPEKSGKETPESKGHKKVIENQISLESSKGKLRSSRSRNSLADWQTESSIRKDLSKTEDKAIKNEIENLKTEVNNENKVKEESKSDGNVEVKTEASKNVNDENEAEQILKDNCETAGETKDIRRSPELNKRGNKGSESSEWDLSPPVLEKQTPFHTENHQEGGSDRVNQNSSLTDVYQCPELLQGAPLLAIEGVKEEDPSPEVQVPNLVLPERNDQLFENYDALNCIFKYLSRSDLTQCSYVSRAWCKAAISPHLFKKISVNNKIVTPEILRYIVRRQPMSLDLSWAELSHSQLRWMIMRIPKLEELKLAGTSVATAFALTEFLCPPLTSLDLSFTCGLNDGFLRDVFVPKSQVQRPPGASSRKPSLHRLKKLSLAACNITDAALLILSENLKDLTHIDLSQCSRLTSAGLSQYFESPHLSHIEAISLAGCTQVTEDLVFQLLAADNVKYVDISHCGKVTKNVEKVLEKVKQTGRKFEMSSHGILSKQKYCLNF
ncbi:lysine-specific demethylase 2A-like [Artemia franciscana]|uniref:lysine-specific demethylase 2A-like n=1 Tax=Artemia franciscana TaxID=6661 RepID=UPI0032DA1DAD